MTGKDYRRFANLLDTLKAKRDYCERESPIEKVEREQNRLLGEAVAYQDCIALLDSVLSELNS